MKKMKLTNYTTIALCVAWIMVLLVINISEIATASKMVNPVHMTQYSDPDDPHFIAWCFFTQTEIGEKEELIDNELEKIEEKTWEVDWQQVRTYAKSQYNQIETFLNEMNQFNLTPEMKPSADEYRLYLMDKKNATHHLIKAADNLLSDNLVGWGSNLTKFWDYSISANEHVDKSLSYLDAINTAQYLKKYYNTKQTTPKPTPSTSGFYATFTIIALVIIVAIKRSF